MCGELHKGMLEEFNIRMKAKFAVFLKCFSYIDVLVSFLVQIAKNRLNYEAFSGLTLCFWMHIAQRVTVSTIKNQ